MNKNGKKLCPFSLGMAIGVTEGLYMMLFAWAGLKWSYGLSLIHQISDVFPGYAPTVVGGLWGGLFGLIDGFVFGVIIAVIYNLCTRCKHAKETE